MKKYPGDVSAMLYLGVAFSSLRDYNRAEVFFKNAKLNDPSTLLRLINVNLKTGDTEDVNHYFQALFGSVSLKELVEKLKLTFEENLGDPVSQQMLVQEIARKLKEKSREIAKLGKHSRGQCKNVK